MTRSERGRTPAANTPTVAVTGARSPLGSALAVALVGEPAIGRVLGLDRGRADVAGVKWKTADVCDPAIVGRFDGVDAVVHAAVDLDPDADPIARSRLHVDGTRTVVTAAAAAGVRRLVLITSAMVYGAAAANPVPLPDDAPLSAVREGLPGDLLDMEEVAEAARRIHPGMDVVVLRPAALVGPGLDTLITRHFAAPRLLAVREAAMSWQFCHVDDLASAVIAAVLGRLHGDLTVGAEGWLTQDEVEALCGLRRVELPAAMAFGTAERLHRAGVVPTPASELAYVAYPWVVSARRLRDAGWRAAVDNATALQGLLDEVAGERAVAGRRFGLKDATIAGAGAAGATVAVLGAAAIVRRARRLRGV